MAFAVGNQLAKDHRQPKPFRDALMLVLKEAGTDLPRLRRVASALVKQAEKGNVAAAKEIADRLDGKVPQAITGEDGGDIVLQVVRYVVDQPPQVIDITPQSTIEASTVASEPVSPVLAQDAQAVDIIEAASDRKTGGRGE